MKAALYCRVSREDGTREESGSIENQKTMLLQYARAQGWQIYDIYLDDGHSGFDRTRPGFLRLLADAEERQFGIILCKTQSRFTRELELVERYIHDLFPRLGIRFVSIVDHQDSQQAGNKRSRQINGLVNQWLLEDLSDSVRAALTARRQEGLHIGSHAPYGYRKDPDCRGHLLIDRNAAGIVEEIFRLYVAGMGKAAIARTLNGRGVPDPSRYRQDDGKDSLWSCATISRILTDEVYIGNMVQGRAAVRSVRDRKKVPVPRERWIIVPGTHTPIIRRELWDAARRTEDSRSRRPVRGEEGIFARKVRCAHCGGSMSSVKKGPDRGFSCRTHALCPERCPGARISLEKLERVVLSQILVWNSEYLDLEQLTSAVNAAGELRAEVLRRDLEQEQSLLRQYYRDKLRGDITEEAFRKHSAGIRGRMELARGELESLTQTAETRLSCYLKPEKLTRELISGLIRQVVVGRDQSVAIHWTC